MNRTSELIGTVGFSTMLVRPGDCSVAIGLGDLPIVATSHLINVMESASLAVISDFLENGETSRLIHLDLHVLEAVGIGTSIRATATCHEIAGRELLFGCEIYDGERLIAKAEMKRAVIERVSFLARTAAQSIIGHLPH